MTRVRPSMHRVRDFFCDAMLHGWVSGAEPSSLPQFPGFKGYQYEEGPFTLIDMFCSGQQRTSGGQTIIWYDEQPIWTMHYYGQYPEYSIGFLKSTLHYAYTYKISLGGRGSSYYSVDRFTYINHCCFGVVPDFSRCQGSETIFEGGPGDSVSIGYHNYQCFLLE